MPRPKKYRKVCCLPQKNLFGPLNVNNIDTEIILMTVEEYETIRLIDFEGLTQEECAERMNVARTTIQRIYNNARKKLSQTLVNGNLLKIEGGCYKLCSECGQNYDCEQCNRHRFGKNKTKY
ncbi:DUF134 domain-containing protein [Anaerovorax odorimutans]|uniref:DUF134 domain-containing protein n=1 Tax=Anaerovorax odorimutans TaxID=109327 RepID=UPI0004833D0D|nr:DUF134 domain-containing protein [Anaerovorax odorimutans]